MRVLIRRRILVRIPLGSGRQSTGNPRSPVASCRRKQRANDNGRRLSRDRRQQTTGAFQKRKNNSVPFSLNNNAQSLADRGGKDCKMVSEPHTCLSVCLPRGGLLGRVIQQIKSVRDQYSYSVVQDVFQFIKLFSIRFIQVENLAKSSTSGN